MGGQTHLLFFDDMQPRHILLTTKRAALDNLQVKLGYSFVCLDLLLEALTHSSSLNEGMEGCSHNERLEFLGGFCFRSRN